MTLDMRKFRERRKTSKAAAKERSPARSGDWWKPPVGKSLVYVAPPTEEMDGSLYLEADVHYDVGPEKKMVICLDAENSILGSEGIQRVLAKREVVVAPGCPVCESLEDLTVTDPKRAKAQRRQIRYYFAVIPYGEIGKEGERNLYGAADRVPMRLNASEQLWDGICEQFEANGPLCDPARATLLRVTNNGKLINGTYYKVAIDGETLRDPMRLPKPERFALAKEQKPEGGVDLFAAIGYQVKTRADVEAIMEGRATSTAKADPAREGLPSCFGLDCDPDDESCQECPVRVECAKKCGTDVPGAAPEPAPEKRKKKGKKKGKKAKASPPPAVEDEPEPEDEDGVEVDGEEVDSMLAEFGAALAEAGG